MPPSLIVGRQHAAPPVSHRLPFVKVAFHRVTNLVAQRVHGFGLCKNRMTQSAGGVSAFRRFFDEKDEFVHLVRAWKAFDVADNLGNRPFFFKDTFGEWSGGRCSFNIQPELIQTPDPRTVNDSKRDARQH